jgi:hypothetical protein
MPRISKARPAEVLNAVDETINHGELILAGQALNEVSENIAQVELQYRIDMPYNKDAFMAIIRTNRIETGRRLVEIGVMLMHLREREGSEGFRAILEELDMGERSARRMIQSAAKMHEHLGLQSLGSGKMLELMTEDDDSLAALESGGTLAGLTLDDVERMSVRELKATLRAERQERDEEKQTDEDIIRAKDERINKLTRDKRKGSDEQKLRTAAEDLLRDADEAVVEAASHIARLRKVFGDVSQLYGDAGLAVDGDVAERLDANARWAADQLRELSELVGE